jgi:hypothetical protein
LSDAACLAAAALAAADAWELTWLCIMLVGWLPHAASPEIPAAAIDTAATAALIVFIVFPYFVLFEFDFSLIFCLERLYA